MDIPNSFSPLKAVWHVIPLAAVVLAACAVPAARAAGRTLAVEAADKARANLPMCVDLPEKAGAVKKARMTDGGREVPCQVADGKLWWILEDLPAGGSKTYAVELGAEGAAADGVVLKQGEAAIDIAIAGKPFSTYVFAPKPVGSTILRRPYFWPVYGPGQLPMTRAYPMATEDLPKKELDHPHHTSIWVAHGEVNGVDNWSIGAKAGYQVHKSFQTVAGGPVVGIIREELDWTDVAKKPNMAEVRTVRVYRLPDAARMLDLELTFQAKYGKVLFGDTKEGGLCSTRMRPEFKADNKGRLVNSEGLTGGPAWGKPATWCDCSGQVEGKGYGFAIFDTPGNPRFPTTWHARTYGLVTANPFGYKSFDKNAKESGDWTLEEGKEQTFRYRIYLHAGDEKEGKVAERYADYATPPKATWK